MTTAKMDFIKKVTTYETGGNCSVDFVHLKDGRVLGINDDCVVLYDSMADFESDGENMKPRQTIDLVGSGTLTEV